MRSHTGLTLIELLVAMAIGLVVAYTAYTGFNAAVATVARVSIMSQQNRLLRVGLQHALDDVDHWSYYDRADHLDLRAEGHPFHPMEAGEFSSDYLAWQHSSFYAGSTAVLFDELGNYANVGWAEKDGAGDSVWSAGNDVHQRTEWLFTQAGNYAMFDYLPANAIYHYYRLGQSEGWYQSPGGYRWEPGQDTPKAFSGPDANNSNNMMVISAMGKIDRNRDYARLWWPWRPESLRPLTRNRLIRTGNVFFMSPETSYGSNQAHANNHWWLNDVSWRGINRTHPWNLRQFSANCVPIMDLMPSKPAEWSGLNYTIERRQAIYPTVSGNLRVSDPIEGTAMRLNFACIGTSLRGARLQRGLDVYTSHYGTGSGYSP
ncbi:MAG: prepilin-type N-terminal cleavage/methylation domain-containing protein [Planctomycetota bacterium]|jgi:prepilin-type N-terminal cleavage/methylation domain-containing protein|nr:prepilin-type N-terminal cleavage/methylation domain-containing protein [Planctomycetota bacterium]